jgi:hypothetical protein
VLHEFFAAHLSRGGSHITVNFDRCVEEVLGDPADIGPLPLHGRLSPAGLGNLRTRTLQLTNGLAREDATAVTEILGKSELLVFLGYSGRDYFDVDPFFRRLASTHPGSLSGLQVLWVEHRPDLADPSAVDWVHAPVADGARSSRPWSDWAPRSATSTPRPTASSPRPLRAGAFRRRSPLPQREPHRPAPAR